MDSATARLKVCRIAREQVGIREATGQNDGEPAERYMRGQRQVPWCAYFVIWVMEQAGREVPGNWWRLGAVDALEASAPELRQIPIVGDAVFFSSRGDSDTGPGRHVGIVVDIDGDTITTVEGNVSNRVGIRNYKVDNPRITGYAFWPTKPQARSLT